MHKKRLGEMQPGFASSAIFAAAVKKAASDIHIEPRVGNTVVRLRVDGILAP